MLVIVSHGPVVPEVIATIANHLQPVVIASFIVVIQFSHTREIREVPHVLNRGEIEVPLPPPRARGEGESPVTGYTFNNHAPFTRPELRKEVQVDVEVPVDGFLDLHPAGLVKPGYSRGDHGSTKPALSLQVSTDSH